MKFITCLLIGCSVGLEFQKLVALGDSISDTGLVFAKSEGKVPPKPAYWKGRFSNGHTWIEYIAKQFHAELESSAHGQATTDSTVYKIKSPLNIPGCVQQAQELKSSNNPHKVLLTFAFFGNDFLVPGATKEKYFENLEKCLNLVLSKNVSSHILIPTRFAPEAFPYFANAPAEIQTINTEAAQYVADSWSRKLPQLRKKHPCIEFYEFDFKATIAGVIKNGINDKKAPLKLNSTASCLTSTPFEPNRGKVCENPDQFMFYDPVHPSARVHRAIAEGAYDTLNQHHPSQCNSPASYRSQQPSSRMEHVRQKIKDILGITF
ncbi:hypothetical protein DSO57_1027900 [Entomophthora muscae]|uniref:Uncharacterized protein n=1 Tax=Entomophthora muscae TaxID=34485 RepID=A0ACC2UMN5_9FUNG|nr:hypothetical protein DSO57_1027900 [Entomophthora muscae]